MIIRSGYDFGVTNQTTIYTEKLQKVLTIFSNIIVNNLTVK